MPGDDNQGYINLETTLDKLANNLRAVSRELLGHVSAGDYARALHSRRRLGEIAEQAFRLYTDAPQEGRAAYRAALAEANETLKQVHIRARMERDRIAFALQHCGSVRNWVDANRNTI